MTPARELRGAPVAKALTEELARRAEALRARGVAPALALVRVGERADDLAYERAARSRCARAGIEVRTLALPEDCAQGDLADAVSSVNEDASAHACLLFRPLPPHLDERAATALLLPEKDVDGATPGSLLSVFAGGGAGFAPCTAEAVCDLLDFYGVPLDGATATVVGRSLVIGRPVAQLLLARGATVTTCHTRTRDLASALATADVVVVAAGRAGVVDGARLAPRQVVVDVGTNWDERAQALVGDVTWGAAPPPVAAYTPVPGGVGAVTTAVLAKHVIEAAERSSQ